jgi:hypothetical protein
MAERMSGVTASGEIFCANGHFQKSRYIHRSITPDLSWGHKKGAINSNQNKRMKPTKLLTLCAALVCAATLATGCACCSKSKCSAKPACGMKCCADSGSTCATCPTCSKK